MKNINTIKYLVVIYLLISISYSVCGESRKAELLAIIGNEGAILEATINSFPGDSVLINLTIPYGIETQKSLMKAQEFATSYSGNECGFQVTIPSIYEIRGPSAGAFFALKFYEIITDRKPSKEYVVTGGITEEGFLIPVGGIYEKIDAYVKSNKKVMFFPAMRDELNILANAKLKKEGKEGYAIRDIREAIKYLFYNEKINQSITEELKLVNNSSTYDSSLVRKGANRYLATEKELIGELPKEYRNYIEERIYRQEKLIENGYYYTVANDAFDKVSYIKGYIRAKRNESGIDDLEKCLNEISFYEEREDNVEYIAGAKSRYYRALSTYKLVLEEGEENLFFEKISQEAEIEKAIMWCQMAKEFNIKGEGRPVDKEKLKKKIENLNLSRENLNEEMRMLLEDREYTAFLYEYSFIKDNDDELREEYNSIWANVYASQAEYFKNTGEEYANLARISNNMEELFSEMEYKDEIGKKDYFGEVEKRVDLNMFYIIISFLGGGLICMLVKRLKR